MKNTRNMFRLLAAIAAIAALDASARAQTLDKLQFRLNWTLYGEHAHSVGGSAQRCEQSRPDYSRCGPISKFWSLYAPSG